MSDSLRPYGLYPARLLCPWDSRGKNAGVGAISCSRGSSKSGIEHASLTSPAAAGSFFTTSSTSRQRLLSRSQGQRSGLSVVIQLFSRSDSWQPHGLWHSRLPCPSLSPRVCSHSCPLSQSFLASGSFPVSSTLGIRRPKYRSFSITPANEYSGLISFQESLWARPNSLL